MKAVVTPSRIRNTLTAPASKSAMQRACAAALLAGGTTVIHNPGISNDDLAALDIIRQLGATVAKEGDTVVVSSRGIQPVSDTIDCGESGLSIRMFTSIAALSRKPITITGHGSLKTRPMHFFNEVLPQLGVACTSADGKLPLLIRGPLQPKPITVDGSLSSQFLTGLLFAYAGAGAADVGIAVSNLNSTPYVDLTLEVIRAFGLKAPQNENYRRFYFGAAAAPPAEQQQRHFAIEGDWSGAAFLLVAGAVAGQIELKGLNVHSAQADKAILQALVQAGANMSVEEQRITVQEGSLQAFHFNATHCPDLFPPLVALAAYCNGTTVIEGVHRLEHKESNRALTLQQEFEKLGIPVELQDDQMIIRGGGGLKGAEVSSHNDHRIAMACAVAALKASGGVTVGNAQAVNKSYPNFWQHLQQLGAAVSLTD